MKWHFEKYLLLDSEQRQKRFALKWVLIAGLFITILKFGAFFITNANSVLSDGLESLINMAAGSFALYSLYFASRPRDAKHPYGTGKIEFLAATVQGSMVFAAGSVIIIKALYNFVYPHEVQKMDIGAIMIMGGALINIGLGYYLKERAATFNSLVLRADSKRLFTDALSSFALAAGLGLIYITKIQWIDGVLAIGLGIFILLTGYKLVRQSVKGLLDEADDVMLEEFVKVLQKYSHPEWIDFQNIRASHHGMYLYIDCQLALPWYWNLRQVDEEIKKVEYFVNQHFKEHIELFIRVVPCETDNCFMCRMDTCNVREHNFSGKGKKLLPATGKPKLPQPNQPKSGTNAKNVL